MTLLELLRQELPKRGGWPEGAVKANCYCFIPGVHFWDDNDFRVDCSDLTTRALEEGLVTREQYEAAGWNGEGLPPVGMEIEYRFAKANYRTDFSRGKVLAYGIHNVFMEHWSSKNEFIQPLDKLEFRPLSTEAERAIDEMVRLSGVSIGAAKILYDAGYRK